MAMVPQQTLREPVSYEGVGLHSGNRVSMRFLPAEVGERIRFRRVDLEGRPEIEARVEHIGDTNRSTSLAKGSVRIHTVEHVLAAFAGCGVDNAVVELDANEPPIADGSARAYCDMIRKAGLEPQAEPREVYALKSPIEVVSGDSTLTAFPHDRLKITCTSADKRGYFTQFNAFEIMPDVWDRELSHARTFCFFEEIEYLYRNGLIRGGSLENAVVIRDDAVLTTEPLRYPDEFVRHKILDVLGDISLVGLPVHAHIVAVRPSHSANCELARRIAAQRAKPLVAAQTFAPPPPAGEGASVDLAPGAPPGIMDIQRVMNLLPHRFPFLMVDRVTAIEGRKITAVKNVTINEPFFQGHFPDHPVMPGVLQLEAMAQVAGILTMQEADGLGKLAYFMSADKVKWRKPVRPGDTLVIEVVLTKARGRVSKGQGCCRVNGEVVSEAEITFTLVDA